MIRNSIKQIVFILFILNFCSCESKFDSEDQQIVLHSLIFNGEAPKIILSQSLDAFPEYAFNVEYYDQPFYNDQDQNNIEIIVSSGDQVFTNFEMKQEPITQSLDSYYYEPVASSYITYFIDTSFVPEYDTDYAIEIKELPDEFGNYIFGFDYIKSSTRVPQNILCTMEQQKDELSANMKGSDTLSVYTISFDDPPGKNYYFLTLSEIEGTEEFSMDTVDMDKMWMQSMSNNYPNLRLRRAFTWYLPEVITDQDIQRLRLEYGINGFFIVDDNLRRQKISIRLKVNFYGEMDENSYFVVELLNISEEYYNYYTTILRQGSSQLDIFSEPTQLYTNVENGLGVFAGASMSTSYMKIVSKPE